MDMRSRLESIVSTPHNPATAMTFALAPPS
jgi:hypothetical protein